jgi:hypothetical protein
MKKLLHPLANRRPAGAPRKVPGEARRPFRLWMTGSLAVVMAAMMPLRAAAEAERSQAMRVLRHSRHDVGETLRLIEIAARDRGFSVLALVPGAQSLMVFASSLGGTLVVMNEADSRLAMPMSLMVRAHVEGGAEVLVAQESGTLVRSDWAGLPPRVVDELEAMPGWVEHALGA